MNVLVLGSGGREHSLAWRLAQDPSVARLSVAPGNPGIEDEGLECIEVDACDPQAVLKIAQDGFDLVISGPEPPLVAGVADVLRENGISVFGPSKDGAQLEGSKAWMKELLVDAGVPTAQHRTFHSNELDEALTYLETIRSETGSQLSIIKTDGLAFGKGVTVTESLDEAREAVTSYLSGQAFGDAGTTCVIEEGMTGPEISLFAICDGKDATCIGVAQDHKRIGDGDTGLNTGGMGAYCPVPFVDDMMIKEIMDTCIAPTLNELRKRGIDYRGVLYAGLMLTPSGPKMIEYNIRFGDPECQILMMRLTGDLAITLKACADGELAKTLLAEDIHDQLGLTDYVAITVVMCAKGYPEDPQLGDVISRIDEANTVEGVKVFHAGTKRVGDHLVTSGGRVLNVTAIANSMEIARERAYEACAKINYAGKYYRRDIAYQALNSEDTHD
ncbi:MAG TPA: phosphoribosylamine--glycine ligase [Acidimicrobiia bacterium]|nr:phosphoribosylamine--glycine ligase [Acidimicrobiia bacterium]